MVKTSELKVGDRVQLFHEFDNGRRHNYYKGTVTSLERLNHKSMGERVLVVIRPGRRMCRIEVARPDDLWEVV